MLLPLCMVEATGFSVWARRTVDSKSRLLSKRRWSPPLCEKQVFLASPQIPYCPQRKHKAETTKSCFRFVWLRRRDLNPRPYGPEPYALPTALRLNAKDIIYSKCFSVKCFLAFRQIKFALNDLQCYNIYMVIHHDKLAYGKLAPKTEQLSELQITEMLKQLNEEEDCKSEEQENKSHSAGNKNK